MSSRASTFARQAFWKRSTTRTRADSSRLTVVYVTCADYSLRATASTMSLDTTNLGRALSHLKPSVSLANAIMAGKPFQDLVERFFGRKQFKKVSRLVRLDDSSPRARKMPATVLAETIRCVPLTDYTIHLNWRFRVQQDAHPLAIENKRLRFVTAVTIIHEIWHLCLRHNGILNTPERLRGLWGPEAGEFFEKMLFGGLITMRLSKDERNNTNIGWNPGEMKVTAVLLRNQITTEALSDSEIEKICDFAASQVCLPADTFPVCSFRF